jgi:hypothetical protein
VFENRNKRRFKTFNKHVLGVGFWRYGPLLILSMIFAVLFYMDTYSCFMAHDGSLFTCARDVCLMSAMDTVGKLRS